MSVQDTAPEEIIDLTDIVEEGIPLDAPADDVPLATAVDARILDDELDSLLGDDDTEDRKAPATDDMDFDQLLAETAEAMTPSPKQQVDPGLDDLDEIFNAMAADKEQQAQTALDAMLDAEDADRQPLKPNDSGFDLDELLEDEPELTDATAKSRAEEEPLPDTMGANLLDITDELLADIPDTVLTPPAGTKHAHNTDLDGQDLLDLSDESLEPDAPATSQDTPDIDALMAEALGADVTAEKPSLEAEEIPLDLPAPSEEEITPPSAETHEGSPISQGSEPVLSDAPTLLPAGAGTEFEISRAEVDRILERLDVLEAAEGPTAARLVALLPDNPAELPAVAALKSEILTELDTRLSDTGQTQELEGLRQTVTEQNDRLQTLEQAVAHVPTPDQLLALIPENPDALPATAALKAQLATDLEARLSANDRSAILETLQQDIAATTARLQALEDRPAPSLSADQVLPLLPENPDDLPLAHTLREDIRSELDARLARVVESDALDALRSDLEERIQQGISETATRIQALEERPEPSLTADQVLPLLPENPDDLPLAHTLREEIRNELDARLARVVESDALDALRSDLEERIAALGKLPDMAALRSELLDDMEARVSSLAPAANLDTLQQTVEALQNQMDAMPDQLGQQGQKTTADIAELRRLTETQAASIEHLTAALADRENQLSTQQDELAALRAELAELQDRTGAEARDRLRQELQGFIAREIPGVAARILREEIQNLLKDLNG